MAETSAAVVRPGLGFSLSGAHRPWRCTVSPVHVGHPAIEWADALSILTRPAFSGSDSTGVSVVPRRPEHVRVLAWSTMAQVARVARRDAEEGVRMLAVAAVQG